MRDLPSYKPCEFCGAHCWLHDNHPDDEPCWGMVVKEHLGEEEIHLCDGHGVNRYYRSDLSVDKEVICGNTQQHNKVC